MESMEYNFELFEGVKGRFTPLVSISKPGYISFSSGTQKRFGLSSYKGALLYFDKTSSTIAIKFLVDKGDEYTKSAVNLKHRSDNKGSYIACKSFIDAYELGGILGKKYTPKEIDHPSLGKLMILDLKEEEKEDAQNE